MKKSAFLVVFQARLHGQLIQTDFSTVKNPLNSRQIRRDCEFVARRAFEKLAGDIGLVFASTEPIKCVEIVEFRDDGSGGVDLIQRKGAE